MTARHAPPAEVGAVTHITTRQDLARWTRAHGDAPGLTWSVHAGPGGTMLIVEHARDRAALTAGPAPAPGAEAGTAAA